MPRSARRRSAPSSPVKARELIESPRQTRRSARTQSQESDKAPKKHAQRQQPPLEPIGEHDDTIIVRDTIVSGSTTYSTVDDTLNDADEVERSSELPETPVSSGDHSVETLDHMLIMDNLVSINQDADDLLGLIKSLPTEQLVEGIRDRTSPTARRLINFAKRLQSHTEPCGTAHMLPLQTLARLFADQDLPSMGPSLIFMKANLARFMLAMLNVRLAEKDLSFHDCLRYLADLDPFPEPFLMRPLNEQPERAAISREFEQKTSSLGLSILTQLYIQAASERVDSNRFDPDLLLQHVFLDDNGNLRDLSVGKGKAKANRDLSKAMEKRMRDLRKYTSTNAKKSVDLPVLQKKYPQKIFLEQAAAWTIERANQLTEAIENEGGTSSIRNSLQAGLRAPKPDPEKLKQKTSRSRQERALEDGASFLKDMDDDLDAAEDGESEAQSRDTDAEQDQDKEREDQVESKELATAERRHRKTISESPQPDARRLEVTQGRMGDSSEQYGAGNQESFGDDGQISQNVPEPAQSPRDWASQPTRETLNVLSVTQRQEKESNKENSPPHRRYGLLDRQPNAAKVSFDDDSQPRIRNRGKRPRGNSSGIDDNDEDDFETDTRPAKMPRSQSGKAAVSSRLRQDRSRPSMFFDSSNEPEEREHSGTTSRPVSGRHDHDSHRPRSSHAHAGPSSSQPPPLGASSTVADISNTQHDSPSASAPPPSSYEGYVDIKRQAQQNNQFASLVSASASSGQLFRPTQVRKAWTADEIRRLIDLMQQYGTSWAKIKQADERMVPPLLTNRSQVQLKDKARNMKLDFLKAEQPMPEFMEGVTISKTHKEQLRRMNIGIPQDLEDEE